MDADTAVEQPLRCQRPLETEHAGLEARAVAPARPSPRYRARHLIGDDDPRELFAWTLPGFRKFSASRAVASTFIGGDFKMTTALHGGPRAIFPNPAFDKIVPLDIVPLFLFKALEVGDIEKAEKLGAFELDEEDLALCSLVDFGKNDFGKTLRALLDQAMKEEE